jgi:DNA-binding Lrp family transcriptional regulator
MDATNPFHTIQQIAGGYCLNRCLHVVAELGVADVLEDAPQTSEELAALVGVSPGALGRVLRLLAAHGIFEMKSSGISHSPASRLLRQDHPQSLKGFVRMFGLPINWKAYEVFDEAVKTGEPVMEKIHPGGLWNYYAEHREESRIFNEAMADKAKGQVQGIMASYDFSRFHTIGDIGGGQGHLLQAVLHSVPHAKGILFDLPHVIEEAAAIASDRLYLQPGDFFKDDLPVCDAYLVMEIIHDWAEEEAKAILRAIRKAAPPHAKLLLIETIIPENSSPDWAKMLDIHMLTLLGGQQRTGKEYENLLAATGFSLIREIDTGVGISILEASLS